MACTRLKSFVAWATTVTFLTLLAASATHVRAQTAGASPSPAPKSAEILRLEEEKAQAELRQAIAEANKAELDARFPKPSTSPLSGTTTVEGAVIESQMVSYAYLGVAANKLVQQLKDTNLGIKTLVIYHEKEVNLLLSYKVALNQLELMKKGYGTLVEAGPTPCPSPEPGSELSRVESLRMRGTAALVGPIPLMTMAQSIFGSFVDLTSLLRTNVEIKGQVFDIEEAALVSEVFRAANAKDGLNASLLYPTVFPPNLDFKVEETNSRFLTELDALNDLKAYAEGLADALEDTQKNIRKAEAAIENFKASVEGLTVRKREAEAKLSDLEEIYGSSNQVRQGRRRIPSEKLELMLELQRTIANLQKQLDEIQKQPDGKLALAVTGRDRLKSELKCLLSKLKPNLRDPENLDTTIAKLRAKNEQFAKFVEALVKSDQISGLNSLTSYIKAENMLSALRGAEGKETDFYWLQLKVLKAGGNNRIKTNLIVDIFTGGNRLSHSGGAVVEYILFDRNGKAVASDILTEYSGYIKSGKIKKLTNPATVTDGVNQ